MTDTVWVSVAPGSTELCVYLDTDMTDRDLAGASRLARRNQRGEVLPSDNFPKRAQLSRKVSRPSKLNQSRPLFWAAGGFWFVSEKCAETLKRFDLGQAALYPVDIYETDGVTPAKGRYFCLSFANVKQAFVPTDTPSLMKIGGMDDYRQLAPTAKDGDVTVIRTALDGPDIWVDKHLIEAFFLSDGLAQALRAARLDKPFMLRRCSLI